MDGLMAKINLGYILPHSQSFVLLLCFYTVIFFSESSFLQRLNWNTRQGYFKKVCGVYPNRQLYQAS